jgi:hypothetical protein
MTIASSMTFRMRPAVPKRTDKSGVQRRRFTLLRALVSFVAVVIIATGAATSAATAAPQVSTASPVGWQLQNPIAGKCITVKPGLGAWLYQYSCIAGNRTQEWTFSAFPGPTQIQLAGTSWCMQDAAGSNIHIILESCNSSILAQWYDAEPSGRVKPYTYYMFINYADSQCISVSGGSRLNNTSIVRNICNANANYDQFSVWWH